VERGDVWLTPFLYADLGTSKRRPVCVVSRDSLNAGPDVIIAMVTSRRARLETPGVGDVPIRGWQDAGLLAPSTVRAGRLQTIEAGLLVGRLGTLGDDDLDAVNDALRDVLQLA
jgi:mRNA-degrading endonuclease toxin of MazEF toxin-antitoxin module